MCLHIYTKIFPKLAQQILSKYDLVFTLELSGIKVTASGTSVHTLSVYVFVIESLTAVTKD